MATKTARIRSIFTYKVAKKMRLSEFVMKEKTAMTRCMIVDMYPVIPSKEGRKDLR